MKKVILSTVLWAFMLINMAATPNPIRHLIGENYIRLYYQLAIMESLRTGIPASIKLAQALLESNYGRSHIATKANNHFGIKWKTAKDGDFEETVDDEKNELGEPVISRFVKFNSPKESYQKHSEVLLNRPRYSFLFDYERDDYRSWAYGLQDAGYASNPRYAEHLIELIEQYKLYRFDIPSLIVGGGTDTPPNKDKPNRDNSANVKPKKVPTIGNSNRPTETSNREHETYRYFEITPTQPAKNSHNNKSAAPKKQK